LQGARWLKRWWGNGFHLCASRFMGNCENRIPKRGLYQTRLAFWGRAKPRPPPTWISEELESRRSRICFAESACRNSLPLVYSESTIGKGGASDTGMCRTSYCFLEERIEKSRLTPPNPKYTPNVSSKRPYRPSQAK